MTKNYAGFLSLQNITKSYEKTIIIKGLTADIEKGELVTFIGPSGCGKSTLLRCIAGFTAVDSGKIILDGKLINDQLPAKRGTGMVFQNYALFPHLSVENNIGYGLKILKLPKVQIKKRVAELLELVQLAGFGRRRISQISGGQQQRVALARALSLNPKILLLDEPLSNLDANLRVIMRGEIKRIQKQLNLTVIFVTHDQEEAMSISDQIVIMKDGLLQQTATPREMYDNPINVFVAKFLGNPPINMITTEIKNGKINVDGLVFHIKGAEDQTVSLGLRPEDFKLDANSPVQVEIQSFEYFGRETLLFVYLGGVLSRVIIDSDLSCKKGDKVGLALEETKFLLFDLEGQRINV